MDPLECKVKIHNWRSENLLPNVRHAGPAGSGCCRVTRDSCLIQNWMGTSLVVSGRNRNKDAFCALILSYRAENENSWAATSFTPPSSKIIELWQLRSDLSRDLYSACRTSK